MSYEAILTALADPTRRAILDRMRGGPLAVGTIADPLPVSRPAVSQHLKVLAEAGLVTMTSAGRRNLYALAPGGAAALVDWLGDLSARPEAMVIDGLMRSLAVRLTPTECWQLFCEDLAIWWPVAVVSVSASSEGALPQAVVLSAEPGGSLREILFDGSEAVWATVREAAVGERIVFDWALGTPGGSTVTVRMEPLPDGTRLTLIHDAETEETARMWDLVLMERFAAAAASSLSNF
ncbi:metalloregulator ArsR/SmtB family transcription factor [Jannaschia sp. M317]|uniref:ArsR/SmtB family transcription factor n=1 Tax=Jannaschia sp. M317 TaxID=2867011 RepID=UPI0021A2B5BC|nr:metalloregulator ArsR/SmtB family transcription factor [Jannaschia sp. M317]UWQ16925.1 metalloregulator ArsR/SmtB family transcription factor [Jannaschia sp. M317]